MIAHPFSYACPASAAEAAQLLAAAGGGGAVLAGGTWLVPHMSRAEKRPSIVVDLRLLGLSGAWEEDGAVVLGPCITYDGLRASALVRNALPLLAIMAEGVSGGRGITGQGTIGGSACYATPASDIPGCLVALGARLRLTSREGAREVPAASFFTGPFRTVRQAGEFLSAIVFDRPSGATVAGYHKLKLSGSSWPIVTAACCLERHGDGSMHATVAIGAAGPVPVAATALLPSNDPAPLWRLAEAATGMLTEGWSDELADAGYRLEVAPEVVRRAVEAGLEALHG